MTLIEGGTNVLQARLSIAFCTRPVVFASFDTAASIWPGDDASHSTSSAQQLRELMPRMEYWDLHPAEQTAENMLERIVALKRLVETTGLPSSPPMPGPTMPPLS
jgi:hypothetical protein